MVQIRQFWQESVKNALRASALSCADVVSALKRQPNELITKFYQQVRALFYPLKGRALFRIETRLVCLDHRSARERQVCRIQGTD